MKKYFVASFGLLILFLVCLSNMSNKVITNEKTPPGNNTDHPVDGSFFNGSWTYRSLLNDPNWKLSFDRLQFASAIMDLRTFGNDSIAGILYWADNPKQGLNITGKYYYEGTMTYYSLVGTGTAALGTPGWRYDYKGSIVPKWPNGINQADALAGSTIRVKPHNGAAAGFVATTYMVRRSN